RRRGLHPEGWSSWTEILGLRLRLADRRRKESIEPRTPHRLLARGDGTSPVAVEVEADVKAHLPAHRHRGDVRGAPRGLLEPERQLRIRLLGHVLDGRLKARRASRGLDRLADARAHQAERLCEFRPGLLLRCGCNGHELHLGARLAAEAREVALEDA